MAVSKEMCALIQEVGELADREWREHGSYIAGGNGYKGVHYMSVKMCHPAYPIFMYELGSLAALSNGVCVDLWGSNDPVVFPGINVNHSQTRKSRLTSLAEQLVGNADKLIVERMTTIFEEKHKFMSQVASSKRRRVEGDGSGIADSVEPVNGSEEPSANVKPGVFPGTWSVAFLGGTLERVKERCAGDFNFVKQSKSTQKLPGILTDCVDRDMKSLNAAEKAIAVHAGMQGRPWYGQGLIFDEAYGILEDISILNKASDKKPGETKSSGQCPAAGWFNRLVQYGLSDHETKSNGTHGGLGSLPVTTTFLGNIHVTPAVEMFRGARGDHGCQAKARLFVATGAPVQPHQLFHELSDLKCEVTWVKVPDQIHAAIGLSKAFANAHAFKLFFSSDENAGAEEEEDQSVIELQPFLPDAGGYEYELPDGVPVYVRMALGGGQYVPQWCLPQRDVKIPEQFDIHAKVPGFVKTCNQTPHRLVTMDAAAKGAFLSYQTFYNILVKQARDDFDADSGAENGIGPWKVGMIATLLLLWDILWGVVVPAFKEEGWQITSEHIERAYKFMTIQDKIKNAFRTLQVEKGGGTDEADAKADGATDDDRDLETCVAVQNVKTTEIARRMLCKGTEGETAGTYIIHSRRAYSLFTGKETTKRKVKVSVSAFRDIAKACPETLGSYAINTDLLTFTMPEEPDQAFKDALQTYANITVSSLKTELQKSDPRGGARDTRKKGK
jgi:hypothetical protein